MLMCIQNLVQLCPFIHKISRNGINQGPYLCYKFKKKMMVINPNLDLANNVYTKYGQILSIHSQDIERKQNSDLSRAITITNLRKMIVNNPILDLVNFNV